MFTDKLDRFKTLNIAHVLLKSRSVLRKIVILLKNRERRQNFKINRRLFIKFNRLQLMNVI